MELKFCCQMRQKFLIGLIGENTEVPTPIDLADFIINWGEKGKSPMVFRLMYCPFCGKKMDETDTLRIAMRTEQEKEDRDEQPEF